MSKSDAISDDRIAAPRSRLERLYRCYTPWLTARLRRRFGGEAEDIVQDAWIRFSSLAGDADVRHPRAFLLTIASNLALSRDRRDRRRVEILSEAAPVGVQAQEAEQSEALALEEIILSLPQPLRDVFVLSRFGGLTNTQIAEHLGISPKTAEWRMTRALAHCAAQLRR